MLTQSTRPKCKADTHYLPMSDGVYLRGNSSRLILKGKSLYPLLAHLLPNLNGDLTLEELTANLDPEKKRMVTHLIEKLFAHRFLRDASQDELHTLDPEELEAYASDIAFIESFQTSAASRFACFRNKRLLMLGSGPGLIALVQAGLQCGMRSVNVLSTRLDEYATNSLQDALKVFSCADATNTVRLIDVPRWDDEAQLRELIQDYDAILHIAEAPMLAQAQLLNQLCLAEQKICMQAVVVQQRAWLGPLVAPENKNCWECAWRRLQANMADTAERLAHSQGEPQAEVSSDANLTMAGMDVIANRLLFELFRYFTQTGPTEVGGKVSLLHLTTYLSEGHTFLPHPHCLAHQHPGAPTASQFLAHMRQFRQQAPGNPEGLLEEIAACIDEETGLFTALDTSDFVQVPLTVFQAQLAGKTLPLWQSQGETQLSLPADEHVIAVGTDARSALTRAAQKACERYAVSLVDQRRLLSPENVRQSSLSIVPGEQLIEAQAGLSTEERWTWALDLRTQEAALVPAARVFAARGDQARGLGSGQTWEEALCQGLLDWCNAFTVAQARNAQQAYPQLDLANMAMTPESEYLYGLLNATESQVTAYDLTGPLGVPTFALCLDGKAVAYSTHCDMARALCMGLEQVLQQYQSEHVQQPGYALAPVEDLAVYLRSEQLSLPSYALPGAWPERLAWLLTRLESQGLRTYVVPLDHDPALARVVPFIARVLVAQVELGKGE